MPSERSLLGGLFSPSRALLPTSFGVPGLRVAPEAVTAAEEAALLRAVDASPEPWTRRRTRITKNYGPYYLFNERDTASGRFRYTDGVVRHAPLPDFLDALLLPLVRKALTGLQGFCPNQVHVALYRAGEKHKIRMHNDNKMGELGPHIVGVCLSGDAEMTFVRPRDGRKRVVRLPRRCVYVMEGESHFEWRHGILGGDTAGDRVSFTLREVRKLAVEEGVHVKKSKHRPSERSIERQRERDCRRMEGGEKEVLDIKLADT